MEELRIDCLHQTEEELVVTKELRQNIFRLNHTMPDTEEYRELLHKVFPHLGENCRIETPFSGVRTANVKFGRNVIVMPGCLMISAGGITIGENAEVGVGEYAESKYDKKVYQFDLVTIGERSVIPDGVKIGRNTAISGVTTAEDYHGGELESGDYIIKAGGIQ